MANNFIETQTPCIGICSTIYGDDICRGCFRSCQVIIDWNTYPAPQKIAILNDLNQLITTCMQDKIYITDALLLEKACVQLKIKIRPNWHPLTWGHALLRGRILQTLDLSQYGFQVYPAYARLSLPQLIEQIDTEIYRAAHRFI